MPFVRDPIIKMTIKSKLTTEEIIKLYKEGKSIYDIAPLAGIGPVAVWKRLNRVGFKMDMMVRPWAKEKRGKEFLGSDGRMWVRGIKSGKNRSSKRKAVLVMEEHLGYPIPKGYHVHHIDGNPLNDNIENLQLLTHSEHSKKHYNKQRLFNKE